MTLYEIETGFMGQSEERCYAWAESEERARQLFDAKGLPREARHVRALMTDKSKEFITQLSDSGWEE